MESKTRSENNRVLTLYQLWRLGLSMCSRSHLHEGKVGSKAMLNSKAMFCIKDSTPREGKWKWAPRGICNHLQGLALCNNGIMDCNFMLEVGIRNSHKFSLDLSLHQKPTRYFCDCKLDTNSWATSSHLVNGTCHTSTILVP
jgi:hypothetical protein